MWNIVAYRMLLFLHRLLLLQRLLAVADEHSSSLLRLRFLNRATILMVNLSLTHDQQMEMLFDHLGHIHCLLVMALHLVSFAQEGYQFLLEKTCSAAMMDQWSLLVGPLVADEGLFVLLGQQWMSLLSVLLSWRLVEQQWPAVALEVALV